MNKLTIVCILGAQINLGLGSEISSDMGLALEGMVSTAFPDIRTSQLKLHGCWCKKMFDKDATGGKPIDSIDNICKKWFQARRCIRLKDGSCWNGIDFDAYTVNDSGLTGESFCNTTAVGCENDLCQVDYHFSQQLELEGATSSQAFLADTTQTCTPADSTKTDLKCEGTAPEFEFAPYNRVCVNEVATNWTTTNFPTTSTWCGMVFSTRHGQAEFDVGNPWNYDFVLIYEGSGTLDMGPGWLGQRGWTTAPMANFYKEARATALKPGCNMVLYKDKDCNDPGFDARADCPPSEQWIHGDKDMCTTMGPDYNAQAVFYTCSCDSSLRSFGEGETAEEMWNM